LDEGEGIEVVKCCAKSQKPAGLDAWAPFRDRDGPGRRGWSQVGGALGWQEVFGQGTTVLFTTAACGRFYPHNCIFPYGGRVFFGKGDTAHAGSLFCECKWWCGLGSLCGGCALGAGGGRVSRGGRRGGVRKGGGEQNGRATAARLETRYHGPGFATRMGGPRRLAGVPPAGGEFFLGGGR